MLRRLKVSFCLPAQLSLLASEHQPWAQCWGKAQRRAVRSIDFSGDLESKVLAVFLVPVGTSWVTSRVALCLSEPHWQGTTDNSGKGDCRRMPGIGTAHLKNEPLLLSFLIAICGSQNLNIKWKSRYQGGVTCLSLKQDKPSRVCHCLWLLIAELKFVLLDS